MSTDAPRLDPWTSEQVITCADPATGLRAVVAIDDSTLGPGFGGVRYRAYPSTEAAIQEAQRLARAMTYKHALAELPYGGAKSVILADGAPLTGERRRALLEAFGDAVARTHGRYIPGVDMGTTLADMDVLRSRGAKVYCADADPAPWTARGAFVAMRAGVRSTYAAPTLDGLTVAVQGAGNVGGELARLAAADGARVLVADVDEDRAAQVAEQCGGTVVGVEEVVTASCDVLAPAAVARVVTREVVPQLRCRVISGAANDVLDDASCEALLAARGITFVPDFVANAGGVIHEHARALGWSEAQLIEAVDAIGPRVLELVEEAAGGSVVEAALARGRARLAAAR
ncbi:Glu/Leu/Phe/Val dehydrogenase dimerization domain-containing protein [Arsenicicoccus sp. oral taxon 190]|uniref:Glu/Leu/Phe/Val dehydrogenase dimerization domain-containing protein n=1 Tax=Arsenicicoccus sp. oral taxon 190 TaxID=1658671 RepID=UPI00067A4307|nr:Glu/Leu/Phe/Val dehydrogenase dimerization domain-containing protein [Arsenicicoccus sp. oral taxon 190]AKT51066.1 leucine dehydrogenase [Arsenicicoccus sp. oral taxon 190]